MFQSQFISMNRKIARIGVTLFIILSAVIILLINHIPRGNFIAAPVITRFIYTPLIIIQGFLLVQVWVAEKKPIKTLNWIFYSSLLLTFIFIYFFCEFLITNPA